MSTRTNPHARRRQRLEREAISFTVGLYVFICAALLGIHYLAPGDVIMGGSSSTSPFNP